MGPSKGKEVALAVFQGKTVSITLIENIVKESFCFTISVVVRNVWSIHKLSTVQACS